MENVYLLLGGNLGDVAATFESARKEIGRRLGKLVAMSGLYESEPWGFESERMFLNQVLKVATEYSPEEIMQQLLEIELALGRTREKGKLTSRLIDLDLLFYGHRVIDQPQLQVPHPRLHLRRFTLMPLVEIAPEKVHPVLKKNMKELLDICPDHAPVIRIGDPSQD